MSFCWESDGTTMNGRVKTFGLLLDLLLLAASLTTGGGIGTGIRTIAVLCVAVAAGLVVFSAVVLAIGLWSQSAPPYPMGGTDG